MLLARGPLAQLWVLLLVLVCLDLLGGLAAHAFNRTHHPTLLASLWWAFLRLTDTGYLGTDQGWVDRTIGLILTFSGDVLFLGALVAILSTALMRALAILSSGQGQVQAQDHLIVVGAAGELPDLAEEILSSQSLQSQPASALVLVVPRLDAELALQLRSRLPKTSPLPVILRAGDPLDLALWRRLDWQRARCLVLQDVGQRPGVRSEALLGRILLGLLAEPRKHPLPRLVVEVAQAQHRQALQRIGWPAEVDCVVQERYAAHILALCLFRPGLGPLLHQLCTDQSGMSIHLFRAIPTGQSGCRLGQCIGLGQAIPIGVWGAQGLSLAQLEAPVEDSLVVLAASPQVPLGKEGLPEAPDWTLPAPPPTEPLLICGESPNLAQILEELRLRGLTQIECWDSPEHLEAALLERDLTRFSTILLLSEESPQDAKLADLEVLARAHALSLRFAGRDRSCRVVCELYLEDNAQLVWAFAPDFEVVPTQRMVSYVVAQVAAKPALCEIYDDLLAPGGSCFDSLPLPVSLGEVCFAQAQALALHQQQIALGFWLAKAQEGWLAGVHLAPAAHLKLQAGEGVYLLLLRSEGAQPEREKAASQLESEVV